MHQDSVWDNMLSLEDSRKSAEPQLWVAGCSISHGVGVTSEQRFGTLLAKDLTQEVSFLTKPGTSIPWAADQILRSNIQKGDTVIWGITAGARTMIWKNGTATCPIGVTPATYQRVREEIWGQITGKFLYGYTSKYQSVISVFQVINFCKLLGAKLVLGSMLPADTSYLEKLPNFINLVDLLPNGVVQFQDLGSDLMHPGPKTHTHYAEQFLKKYKEIS